MCLSQLWAQNTERLNSKSYTLSSKNGGDAKVNSGLGSEHTEGGKVGANRGGGGKTKLSLPQGSSLCCSSLPLLFLFKRKSATLPIRTSWVHWFFRLKEGDALVSRHLNQSRGSSGCWLLRQVFHHCPGPPPFKC